MIITKTVKKVRAEIESLLESSSKKIAFVPTMGALHEGHLALIQKAKESADIVVVSIFVNKSQFNEKSDFENYPRQDLEDIEKLKELFVDLLFIPEDEEVFPEVFFYKAAPIDLSDCLCGASRPGHFDGVYSVVARLFMIIKPNIAIFGEKDFQQLAIIRKLVQDLNFNIEILSHQTFREENGLAMSSRNKNLSVEDKTKAAQVYRTLSEIRNEIKEKPKDLEGILLQKSQEFLEDGFEKIDYLEVREEENLKLITKVDVARPARIFIAVYLSGVRLIDNLKL